MALPDDLLELRAETGARAVALHFLDEAALAFRRLGQPDDTEALHDFRVGLRRLRSAVRSYGPQLHGALSRRQRHRLRDLARATGASRDAEVHVAWLAEQRESLTGPERAGAEVFAARLAHTRREADDALGDEVIARFPKLRGWLARRLRRYEVEIDVEHPIPPPTFGAVTAALLDTLGTELELRLAAVRGIDDQETAHEARIAGKRLRYALEPLVGRIDGAEAVVKQLKRLQDALGDLHDADVFAREVEALRHDCGANGGEPDPRPGLDALAARLHERRDRAFATAEGWFGDRAGALLTELWRVARRLAHRSGSDVEIERKFLLRALPEQVARVAPKEIDQGYLPGERLVERVRRVRVDGTERYFRTVKLGAGVRRTEVEEATTRELFDALWPLTAGRRVQKRRYVVPDGALEWEIDDFADRDLVLAEVELPSADAGVEVPAWLAPLVVRDVTDEAEFVNARLAR